MKRIYTAAALSTALILIEGLFLGSLNIVAPSMLVVAVLIAAQYPLRPGWILALWCGFLLDVMSMQIFGAYIVLAGGMFVMARLILARGLEISRFVNIVITVAVLTTLQVVWRMVLFISSSGLDDEMWLLAQYGLWQAVFTAIVAFFILRGVRSIMKV